MLEEVDIVALLKSLSTREHWHNPKISLSFSAQLLSSFEIHRFSLSTQQSIIFALISGLN